MFERVIQQPIKAKQAGRGGFKHTLAHLALSEGTGQAGIRLACGKAGCGCEAFYALEELHQLIEQFNKREDGGKDGEQAASSENRAA
jgi:hypothetical protein